MLWLNLGGGSKADRSEDQQKSVAAADGLVWVTGRPQYAAVSRGISKRIAACGEKAESISNTGTWKYVGYPGPNV